MLRVRDHTGLDRRGACIVAYEVFCRNAHPRQCISPMLRGGIVTHEPHEQWDSWETGNIGRHICRTTRNDSALLLVYNGYRRLWCVTAGRCPTVLIHTT